MTLLYNTIFTKLLCFRKQFFVEPQYFFLLYVNNNFSNKMLTNISLFLKLYIRLYSDMKGTEGGRLTILSTASEMAYCLMSPLLLTQCPALFATMVCLPQ